MNDQVCRWLEEGGSFVDGLGLLMAVGDTAALKRLSQYAAAAFIPPSARRAMVEALTTHADTLHTSDRAPAMTVEIRRAPAPRTAQPLADEPQEITQLRQRGRSLKKQESRLHAELCITAQQEEGLERKDKLYSLAVQIMKIEHELDEVYGAIREWEKEGTVPISNREAIVQDTVAKMQKRESIRTRIYKIKGWLNGKKELSAEDRRNYEKEMLEKEIELKEIEKELGLG